MSVPLREAVVQARREFLPMDWVTGVSRVGNTIVFYVVAEADRARVPPLYLGWPTEVRVTGPVELLG